MYDSTSYILQVVYVIFLHTDMFEKAKQSNADSAHGHGFKLIFIASVSVHLVLLHLVARVKYLTIIRVNRVKKQEFFSLPAVALRKDVGDH